MVLSAESLFFASEIQDDEENSVNKGSNHGSTTSGSGSSIGHSEGRLVNRSKIVLYVTLCLAGVCVSLATFFFVKHQEKAAFESEVSKFEEKYIRRTHLTRSHPFFQCSSFEILPMKSLILPRAIPEIPLAKFAAYRRRTRPTPVSRQSTSGRM